MPLIRPIYRAGDFQGFSLHWGRVESCAAIQGSNAGVDENEKRAMMVKRYDLEQECPNCFISLCSDGAYTSHTDYYKLEQENDHLREALTELREVLTDHPAYTELASAEGQAMMKKPRGFIELQARS